MGSGFSLAEARVLYEIARREPALASDVQAELDVDPGYLSRIVRRFEARGLVVRGRGSDARQRPIVLTEIGRKALEAVDAEVDRHVTGSIAHLNADERAALREALKTAANLLSKGAVNL